MEKELLGAETKAYHGDRYAAKPSIETSAIANAELDSFDLHLLLLLHESRSRLSNVIDSCLVASCIYSRVERHPARLERCYNTY